MVRVDRIPCLWNSGRRRLRETWGGTIQNRLCILGGPIQNHWCISGRPIRNHTWILGGPIQKPIITRMLNLSKRVRKDRVFLILPGLLLRISLGLRPREIPRSSPASPWKNPSFRPLLLPISVYWHFLVPDGQKNTPENALLGRKQTHCTVLFS